MESFSINTKFLYGRNSLSFLKKIEGENILIFLENENLNLYNRNIFPFIHDKNLEYIFLKKGNTKSPKAIEEAILKTIKASPKYIFALGSSSLINYAKMIRYYAKEAYSILESEEKSNPIFIVMPVNVTGGVEASNASFFTNKDNTSIIIKEDNTADYIIIDEKLIDSNKIKEIKTMSYIGLCNSIEVYISLDSNVFSNMYSLQSINLFNRYILSLNRNSTLKNKVHQLQIASVLSGFSNRLASFGLLFVFYIAFNKFFNVKIEEIYSIAMPQIIEYNSQNSYYLSRYSTIAKHLGFDYGSERLNCQALVENLKYISRNLDLPNNLNDLGIEYSQVIEYIDVISEDIFKILSVYNIYNDMNLEDIREIILSLI